MSLSWGDDLPDPDAQEDRAEVLREQADLDRKADKESWDRLREVATDLARLQWGGDAA